MSGMTGIDNQGGACVGAGKTAQLRATEYKIIIRVHYLMYIIKFDVKLTKGKTG
jgi:hypothetical protein